MDDMRRESIRASAAMLRNAIVLFATALALGACQPAVDVSSEVADLQEQITALHSKDEIRDLFAEYGRTLDNRDFAAFGALYARDGEYVSGGAATTAHGPEAIAALLRTLILTNASGANLHTFSNEKIDVNGTTATATSRGAFYVQDANGGPMALMFATYRDELVHEDGRWKFKRREVIGDIPGRSNEERAGMTLTDISGDWIIASSVGADGPKITVYCTLVQDGAALSGSCTPEMVNAQPSDLGGTLNYVSAAWGYDVVFNGNPGRIDFRATSLAAERLEGILSLSGTEAPFTATKGSPPAQ
jgi:ketosteroid isomerase-like protein